MNDRLYSSLASSSSKSAEETLTEMRGLFGPNLKAELEAMESTWFSKDDYELSTLDFDVKGKQREQAALPSPALSDKAVQQLRVHFQRLIDPQAPPANLNDTKEGFILFWYGQSDRAIPKGTFRPLDTIIRWLPTRKESQIFVNLIQKTGNTAGVLKMLNVASSQRITHHKIHKRWKNTIKSAHLDLCIAALRCPSEEDRNSTRSCLLSLLSVPEVFSRTTSLQLAAVLANYCRAAHGWADDHVAASIAHELQKRMSALDCSTSVSSTTFSMTSSASSIDSSQSEVTIGKRRFLLYSSTLSKSEVGRGLS